MPKPLPRLCGAILLLALIAACGSKADPGKARDAGPAKLTVAPLAMPALGVDRVTRFNFIYGDGAGAYGTALKARARKDWEGTVKACGEALDKDPLELDAQRLLASALALQGDHAAAVDHLVAALAADYYRYAPTLAEPDLDAFRRTPHGQAVAALAQQIHDEYARRIKTGVWLVGRRSSFKWPDKPGVQPGATRGELYAYDRDSKRYLRLTHTDHQVAGFVRAPSGGEVAVLGFDRIDRGDGDTPPVIARGWLQVVDTAEWKPIGQRVVLPPARQIAVGYGAGDQLLVALAQASGRWTVGDPVVSSVDRTTGKLTKVAPAPIVPRIELTLDDARRVDAAQGVKVTLAAQGVVSAIATDGGVAIAIPESGQALDTSIAVTQGHVAFATAADPCAKDTAPSLYVADARTGALRHLLSARSRFATRWIDGNVLAYEDGDGAIRLWDAQIGREVARLDDRAGLALDVLAPSPAPVCTSAPVAQPAGAGSDELPPEEGPVTTPTP
ncbi:MAG TPA: hypothetical protein VLX92_30950 [Kofleriaceae bacterium]|nr:hypothetical protein [Kofleriaceae bacterium]